MSKLYSVRGNESFHGTRTDKIFTNLNSSKISSQNMNIYDVGGVIESNITVNNVYTNTSPSIVPNGTLTLTPTSHNHIFQLGSIDNSVAEVDFTLDVDTTSSAVNDMITIMLTITNPGDNVVKMTLSSNFYYTHCGGVSIMSTIENFERMVIVFVYDGTKFVNTNDNC